MLLYHAMPNLKCVIALALAGSALSAYPVMAQITPDLTLGTQTSGACAGTGGACTITNGSRRGGNLFHSFQGFSLPNGDLANFQTSPAIQNVIVRVTGQGSGFVSTINGTIQTTNVANFFLLNPNGIVFGPQASLNIGGSFLATTAERIQFQDGTVLSTRDPVPVLTVSVPVGLQMGQTAVDIRMAGSVLSAGEFDTFSDFSLVGGNVVLDDTQIAAPGRQVTIAGVAGGARVGLAIRGSNLQLNALGSSRANVEIANGSEIDVQAGDGGSIGVYAQNLNISQESVLSAGIVDGQGTPTSQAGTIVLNATGRVSIRDSSRVASTVAPTAIGNGGDLQVEAQSLFMSTGSQLGTAAVGQGRAGNVTIKVLETAAFDGTDSSGTIPTGLLSSGGLLATRSGNIDLTAGSVLVTRGAAILSSALFAQTNAGDITINARDRVVFDGENESGLIAAAASQMVGGVGNAGTIRINTGSLSVLNGARLNASMLFAQGNAGNIEINARDGVVVSGVSSLGVNSTIATDLAVGSVGRGGDVAITAGSLSVLQGATLSSGTSGVGDAGNIILNVRDRTLFDGVGQNSSPTGITTSVTQTGAGNGGDLLINTGSLAVTNNAVITSGNFGQGNSGNLLINAREGVVFDNGRALSSVVSLDSVGRAGDITIAADSLTVSNDSLLLSGSFFSGDSGDITVNARTNVTLTNSPGLATLTFGSGNAGKLTIRAGNRVLMDNGSIQAGSVSFRDLFTAADRRGISLAGLLASSNSTTTLEQLTAFIAALPTKTGNANDIEITARSLQLDQDSQITTQTISGNGGNIVLNLDNLLVMRRGSLISTAAGTLIEGFEQGGNGGNITITMPNGFLISAPKENNDIVANAFSGSGGRVTINAQAIYWFTPRTRAELARLLGTNDPTKLNPRNLPTNDISAISQGSPNLSGTVTLNTPDVDPSRGLVQLPVDLADPTTKLDQRCAERSGSTSSFTITGRGGLAEDPTDFLVPGVGSPRWVEPRESQGNGVTQSSKKDELVVEATAIARSANGTISLVAIASPSSPQSFWQTPPGCRQHHQP
jgi:filamentous hemagglutinin family protein